ncbi:MAG: DNA-directed RNA polymerase subunit alpha [Candidatus Harrisonbacteria bacterium CG10_big_fil_rev_8_21_14_0_10_44_23]|uniref:DNA-directed RNA polymerase subunit alpha n=1 Tax=Candidatus Harrisonbacteria bacterium CG10_big_fil_rev_8_21_14_0_10_44_23 TaxID=1974585 RepID=A0A2H0UQ95_9BACT|nr:MAG: DNA-directed RNA polymerase subunit alpha [Candidatus Harrisonbacteria bacterium CG10_big_fil_rev_8_21_14_0_10_44_23]
MDHIHLGQHLKVKTVSEEDTKGVFEIEGLYAGYGITIGNALRRVLLSSLSGAAITQVKIKGVGHEFTTIEGVLEDVVEILLNLKKIRFDFAVSYSDYETPEILTLKKKGEGEVTAGDIKESSLVRVINKDQKIATITQKGVELEMELTIEKGLGYAPVESFKSDTLPVGVIQIDAIFSPIAKVNSVVENMRVGDRTDFNRVRFTIETDGTIKPSVALGKAAKILKQQFSKVLDGLDMNDDDVEAGEEKKEKKATKKKAKK